MCSPVRKLFQYQAGPAVVVAADLLELEAPVFPNGSGSWRIGVSSDSGAVRSTTSTRPAAQGVDQRTEHSHVAPGV